MTDTPSGREASEQFETIVKTRNFYQEKLAESEAQVRRLEEALDSEKYLHRMADERIERDKERIATLRTALERIVSLYDPADASDGEMATVARAALSPQEPSA